MFHFIEINFATMDFEIIQWTAQKTQLWLFWLLYFYIDWSELKLSFHLELLLTIYYMPCNKMISNMDFKFQWIILSLFFIKAGALKSYPLTGNWENQNGIYSEKKDIFNDSWLKNLLRRRQTIENKTKIIRYLG